MIFQAKSSCVTLPLPLFNVKYPILADITVVCLYLENDSLTYNYYLLPNYSIFASLQYFSSHV